MSKSDPHKRDTSKDPKYAYHTPGMPQYKTAPPGTPNQLQTGGWLGGVASKIASSFPRGPMPTLGLPVARGFTALGVGGLQPRGMGMGMGAPAQSRVPQRTGNTANEPIGSFSTNHSTPRPYITPTNIQPAVDRSLAQPRSAAETGRDPLNWAGIARDLGNAGSPGFAKYKTGGYASSAAQSYVKNSNAASVEGPPTMASSPAPKAPLIGRGPR